MITKLLILFISGFSGAMLGCYFFKRERNRVGYYKELIGYCDYLIGDIGFRQQTLSVLTDMYIPKLKSSFKQTLTEYRKYLSGEELKLSRLLPKEENDFIKEFFMSIGFSDAERQVSELNNYKSNFEIQLQNAENKLNRSGKNLIKLGFLFGLILGLLFI